MNKCKFKKFRGRKWVLLIAYFSIFINIFISIDRVIEFSGAFIDHRISVPAALHHRVVGRRNITSALRFNSVVVSLSAPRFHNSVVVSLSAPRFHSVVVSLSAPRFNSVVVSAPRFHSVVVLSPLVPRFDRVVASPSAPRFDSIVVSAAYLCVYLGFLCLFVVLKY